MGMINDDKTDTSCVKFRNLFKPLKKWTGLPDCIRKVCSDRDQKGPKKPKIDEQKDELLKSRDDDEGEETVDQSKEGEDKNEAKEEESKPEPEPEPVVEPEPEAVEEKTEAKPEENKVEESPEATVPVSEPVTEEPVPPAEPVPP